MLDATWSLIGGDQRSYTAEISYDARVVGNDAASWRQIDEGPDNKFAIVVDLAELRLRVRGKADGRSGGFTAIDVDPPTIVVAPGTVNYESFTQALKDTVASNSRRRREGRQDCSGYCGDSCPGSGHAGLQNNQDQEHHRSA